MKYIEQIDLLRHILDAYVLKDIINIYQLKDGKFAKDILTKVALQLGSEVSVREIANSLGAYPSTVENFIIAELEKMRKLANAKVNMYFYREYGGKEVDIVLEDYKKNYNAIEIKVDKGRIKNIFPLPNTAEMVNTQNYFEKIAGVLKNK